jgi:hypothetical protein
MGSEQHRVAGHLPACARRKSRASPAQAADDSTESTGALGGMGRTSTPRSRRMGIARDASMILHVEWSAFQRHSPVAALDALSATTLLFVMCLHHVVVPPRRQKSKAMVKEEAHQPPRGLLNLWHHRVPLLPPVLHGPPAPAPPPAAPAPLPAHQQPLHWSWLWALQVYIAFVIDDDK